MKKILLFLVLCACSTAAAFAQQAAAPAALPSLNQQIWDYTHQHVGKKVGRGECWDLAKYSLNEANAKWDGKLKYGKPIDPKKETVLPGDLIQFEGVKTEHITADGYTHTATMTHHTAVVYKVKGKGSYEIAHQNNAVSGRKVGVTDFDLDTVQRGKVRFYRPEK